VLSYDLYLDATHAQEILSGQDFPVTGVSQVTIFGEIPAGQAAPDGSYSDTVSVVFDFWAARRRAGRGLVEVLAEDSANHQEWPRPELS